MRCKAESESITINQEKLFQALRNHYIVKIIWGEYEMLVEDFKLLKQYF